MSGYLPQHPKRSLEFGCGNGGFSAQLKERFGTETWGVELDETAARNARQRLDKVINTDAIASLAHLPDSYFDLVIFFDILEHLADPYLLLRSVKAKLTKEGVIISSVPNVRYYRVLVELVVHGNWEYKSHGVLDETHLRFFTRRSISRMFEESGFEILTLEGIHPTHSRTFRMLNAILLNAIADARYKHFAVVVRPSASHPAV